MDAHSAYRRRRLAAIAALNLYRRQVGWANGLRKRLTTKTLRRTRPLLAPGSIDMESDSDSSSSSSSSSNAARN
ncbi:hypothetical protein KC354_g15011 [Hortaea werneckii]|nr:hypothetical protein KC354_g15011 [Hortaea werneckii]